MPGWIVPPPKEPTKSREEFKIDPLTFQFAENNLKKTGYHDIVLIKGDGGNGYPDMSPYDRICVTAACNMIPPPLVEQLREGGRLIAPVIVRGIQNLVLVEKSNRGVREKTVCEVLYVSLRGQFGVNH